MSFVPFNPEEDIIIDNASIVGPIWSGGQLTLTSFYTSSLQAQSLSGNTYLNVYQSPSDAPEAEVQFSIAYGHVSGSGSAPFNPAMPEYTPTRNIYGQFRTLIYGDENSVFNFGGSNGVSPDIFVLCVNRARYKESLQEGSLNLTLNNAGNILNLTDDSSDSGVTNFIGGNRVYNLVSGSNGSSYNNNSVQTANGSYGLVLPDMGLIILNPRVLALPYVNGGLLMTVDTTSSLSYNALVNTNTSAFYGILKQSGLFSLQSEETLSSKYFFVYVKAKEFNYTTNPSIIDANGNIIYSTLIDSPQTFITTVGLYNDANELLAVAKLSKPLVKDFTKGLQLRVKLDF